MVALSLTLEDLLTAVTVKLVLLPAMSAQDQA